MRRLVLSVMVAAALVLILPSAARADLVFFADITHAQEFVPPVLGTPDRGMFGFATLVLNDAQTALTYSISVFGLDFTGAQTPAIGNDNLQAAHIHASATSVPGVNAGVVFGFFSPNSDISPADVVITPFATGVGGTITGKWDAPEGNGTTLTAQLGNLLADRAYLNFHTELFPGGEIRGQIIATPEPTTLALAGLGLMGLAGYAWRRRRVPTT